MGLKEVKKHLEEFNAQDKIIVFENATTKSAKEAAETIGCTEAEIAKTMGFIVNDTPIVIVTCGDARIDNKKFKARFKVKTKMIKFEETNDILGYNSGGICPFGLKENVVGAGVSSSGQDAVDDLAGVSRVTFGVKDLLDFFTCHVLGDDVVL